MRSATRVFVRGLWLFAAASMAVQAMAPERHDALPVQTARREMAARLDVYLQSAVQTSDGKAGGAVLVARDGVVLLSKGFGYANLEWKIPNTPSTRIHVASLTKSFTATAVMQLRERGLLDLHDSVCKYLSPCPLAWQPVTLHHLLSHTSGIPNNRRGETYESLYFLSPVEHLAHVFHEPLVFAPGTGFGYSNSGYILLGFIIEKVTGKSYEQVIKDQIFEPLGMQDSGYDRPDSVIEHRATAYVIAENRLVNAKNAERFSTGGLYSTVEDLYKFDQALYGTVLLSRESLDLMWRPVAHMTGGEQTAAYGWWLPSETSTDGHRAIKGQGGAGGFRSEMWRFPDEHATIIVLTNMPGDLKTGQLLEVLFDESPRVQ